MLFWEKSVFLGHSPEISAIFPDFSRFRENFENPRFEKKVTNIPARLSEISSPRRSEPQSDHFQLTNLLLFKAFAEKSLGGSSLTPAIVNGNH